METDLIVANGHTKYKILKKGEIYTYRELCEKLNEEFKKDDSRKAQEKEWKTHFRYNVRKNKTISIQEVYDIPLQKIDKRKENKIGKNNIYSNLVQLILLDYLAKNIPLSSGKDYINLSRVQMYEILGMCNHTYIVEFIHKYKQDELHKTKIKKFKEDNKLSEYDLYSFYDRSINKFNEVLNNALKSLKSKSVVVIQDNYVIREIPDTLFNKKLKSKIIERADDGNISRTELIRLCNQFEETETRLATTNELSQIAEIYRNVMDKLGIKDLYQAYQPYNAELFFKELTISFIREMGWSMCYKTMTFAFTESTIKSGVKLIEQEIEHIKLERKELNFLVQNAIDKKTSLEYNKLESEVMDKLLNDEKVFTYKDNYLEAQRIVSEFFMSLNETEI